MARSGLFPLSSFQQFAAINVLSDPGHDPTLNPIPQCMQTRLNWTLEDGKIAHNVLHQRYTGGFPGSVALANSIFTAINNALGSSGVLAQLSTTTSFTGVTLRDLNILNSPNIDSSTTSNPGTGVGESLPNETAAVLTERTAITGQGGRGRIYLVGFVVGSTSAGNVMSAALKTALDTFSVSLLAALNQNALQACLALPSRVAYTGKTGRLHPARTARTQDVTQILCRDNHWDSQRRRGLK